MASFAGIPIFDLDDGEDYGKFLIHGPQGSGKTTLASSIAELGKTLYIDLVGEHGLRSFRGSPWAKNIVPMRPDSVARLDDIFWALDKGDHDFKAVVIDSLTSVQKLAMRYILGYSETTVKEIQQGTAPADQRSWGQTLDIMVDVATFWYSLADGSRDNPMHVVMTAQTKITDDSTEGFATRNPDVQKGALPTVLATPDYVLYTDLEDSDTFEEGAPPKRHIVRVGNDIEYRTKARIPMDKQGKIPPILGRTSQLTLLRLGRTLGIGGIPKTTPAKKAAATEKKEQ